MNAFLPLGAFQSISEFLDQTPRVTKFQISENQNSTIQHYLGVLATNLGDNLSQSGGFWVHLEALASSLHECRRTCNSLGSNRECRLHDWEDLGMLVASLKACQIIAGAPRNYSYYSLLYDFQSLYFVFILIHISLYLTIHQCTHGLLNLIACGIWAQNEILLVLVLWGYNPTNWEKYMEM